MIQAPLQKPIEPPKAPRPRAELDESNSKVRKANPKDVAASRTSKIKEGGEAKTKSAAKENKEGENEFASELATSLGEATVNSVEVSPEQALVLPSTLIQPATGELAAPKVFDPTLTKDVENLIRPTTTQTDPLPDAVVLELAGKGSATEVPAELGPVLPAVLAAATPATDMNGRAPAIDLAKSEIDPQLLNNEDFVAQKNLATRKVFPNAYGMKALPQEKIALESGLTPTQVVKDTSALEGPVNSQQFILGLQTEKSLTVNEGAAPTKVFDLGSVKSGNPTEIMNQITDYVVQARAAKEPTVSLRMNHAELGLIDITVTKSVFGQDAVAINIGAHSVDGKNFFQQNSKDLFTHLTSAGVSVSDLKVETPNSTAKNDFDFGSQSGRNSQSGERQFGSEQNQRRHESDRRKELWNLLNKEAA